MKRTFNACIIVEADDHHSEPTLYDLECILALGEFDFSMPYNTDTPVILKFKKEKPNG